MRPRHAAPLALALTLVGLLTAACTTGSPRSIHDVVDPGGRPPGTVQTLAKPGAVDRRPNIVFVLMDDFSMDLLRTMRSARYMARHGASYDNAFVVDSLCCVSRSSTFTGQYPHQTGVLSNAPGLRHGRGALGGWQAFDEKGGEDRTFAIGLQDAGYTTGYVGKYLNVYPLGAGQELPPIPPGWSDFRAISNEAYDGWDFTSTQPRAGGGHETRHWPAPPSSAAQQVRDGAYAGTVIENLALDFIRSHGDDDAPYFLEIALYATHSAIGKPPPYDDEPLFPPAFRDRPGSGSPHGNCGLVDCSDLTVEDLPGFGEPPANRSYVEYDGRSPRRDFQGRQLTRARAETDLRNRARMAQSVDRMVLRILRTVDDDTYVVLTSDNGFHLGQHGLLRGKGSAYDTDTHVPALVVGPGVVPGRRSAMTSNIDWAATFEDLAGITPPAYRSGVSLAPTFGNPDAPLQDYVYFEHTHLRTRPGADPDRPFTGGGLDAIPSYVAVRSRRALLVRNDLDRRWGHTRYSYEFYDYAAGSPNHKWERVNQFDAPAYAAEVARLMAKLDQFDACRDLRGDDPVPAGCRTLTQEPRLG